MRNTGRGQGTGPQNPAAISRSTFRGGRRRGLPPDDAGGARDQAQRRRAAAGKDSHECCSFECAVTERPAALPLRLRSRRYRRRRCSGGWMRGGKSCPCGRESRLGSPPDRERLWSRRVSSDNRNAAQPAMEAQKGAIPWLSSAGGQCPESTSPRCAEIGGGSIGLEAIAGPNSPAVRTSRRTQTSNSKPGRRPSRSAPLCSATRFTFIVPLRPRNAQRELFSIAASDLSETNGHSAPDRASPARRQ